MQHEAKSPRRGRKREPPRSFAPCLGFVNLPAYPRLTPWAMVFRSTSFDSEHIRDCHVNPELAPLPANAGESHETPAGRFPGLPPPRTPLARMALPGTGASRHTPSTVPPALRWGRVQARSTRTKPRSLRGQAPAGREFRATRGEP